MVARRRIRVLTVWSDSEEEEQAWRLLLEVRKVLSYCHERPGRHLAISGHAL